MSCIRSVHDSHHNYFLMHLIGAGHVGTVSNALKECSHDGERRLEVHRGVALSVAQEEHCGFGGPRVQTEGAARRTELHAED